MPCLVQMWRLLGSLGTTQKLCACKLSSQQLGDLEFVHAHSRVERVAVKLARDMSQVVKIPVEAVRSI